MRRGEGAGGHSFPAALMEKFPRLQFISNVAVGFNNVDVDAATRAGIVVTNTPDVLTETTADLAWSLILGVARRVAEGDRCLREGRFAGWTLSYMLGQDVCGRTLGIVGLGRIGKAVARRAFGFSMKVLWHDPNLEPGTLERGEFPAGLEIEPASFEALLKESDFVSLHCPLTGDTRHLISERELRMMKPTAFLINTTRGPVVDEAALTRALGEGWIAGAGLDVYEREPETHPGLTDQANTVLTPHLGSATHATRQKMAALAVEAAVDLFAGRRPRHMVNPEVFERRRGLKP